MRRIVLIALLGAAACGDDPAKSQVDGGPTDDGSVVDIDALPPEPVSITITDSGQGASGVVVYFQNADSSLVARVETDSTGTASAVMNAGGYVTAVDPYFRAVGLPEHFLRTFGGVKPGDHLLLDNQVTSTSFNITLEGPTFDGINARRYQITTSCGSYLNVVPPLGPVGDKSASGTLTLYDCGATTDLQIVAFDSTGHALGAVYVPDQPVSANATVTLTAEEFQGAPARTYTLTNVPTSVGEFHITDTIVSAKGQLGFVEDDATGLGTGTTTLSMKVPAFANASSVIEAIALSNRNQHMLLEWGPFATTYETDAGARVLKQFSSDLSYSATTHAVTWTESAGATPDFLHMSASGRRIDTFNIYWDMVAPYAEGTAQLPMLPADNADLNLIDTDEIEWGVQMYKVSGGYDAVRAGYFVVPVTASATGTLSEVRFEPPIQPRTRPTSRTVEHTAFVRARR